MIVGKEDKGTILNGRLNYSTSNAILSPTLTLEKIKLSDFLTIVAISISITT